MRAGRVEKEKHFLFPMQEMGAKNPNGGSVSVVLLSPRIGRIH
jgi:hypothetical protein